MSNADLATTRMLVKRLGVVDYEPTWQAMQDFTTQRTAETDDEIWLLQHPPGRPH